MNTPAQLRLAADILETGHPYEYRPSSCDWLKHDGDVMHHVKMGTPIRPILARPPYEAELHNPDGLTAEQVGVGYRLTVEGESKHPEAEVWAASQGADVISESLGDGGGPPIQADLAAYDSAYKSGVSICCAALGNAGYNGRTTIGRPGSYSDHNHGIAALQSDWKTIAGFSSGGPQARYASPGAQIVSCKPGGGWVLMSGTSMATPWQAGLYALSIGWRRGLGYADIRGPKQWQEFFELNKLTVDLGAPGWDPRYGNGLVDVLKVFDFLLDKTSI